MGMPDPTLSARQRAAPPINRQSLRRGLSGGGYDHVEGPRTLAPGIDNELSRYPGTVNDRGIVRDRRPFYNAEHYVPPPRAWVSWTDAGPRRPELHMRATDYRRMSGNSSSRYPVHPTSPTGGMHTMIPSGPASTGQTPGRYGQTPQMRSARQDRLASARYTGQSYSQTTAVQGRTIRGR